MHVQYNDFVPVTGGDDLASRYVRQDLDALRDVKMDSDIDRHILRLLHLHPSLKVKFRNQDLSKLDDSTKRTLIQDMNDVLGIRTLKQKP